MTAIDIALIVIWRTINALLGAAIVVPLFVLLAIVCWPLYERAGVGLAIAAFATCICIARLFRTH